jgi:hypothetical protein
VRAPAPAGHVCTHASTQHAADAPQDPSRRASGRRATRARTRTTPTRTTGSRCPRRRGRSQTARSTLRCARAAAPHASAARPATRPSRLTTRTTPATGRPRRGTVSTTRRVRMNRRACGSGAGPRATRSAPWELVATSCSAGMSRRTRGTPAVISGMKPSHRARVRARMTMCRWRSYTHTHPSDTQDEL